MSIHAGPVPGEGFRICVGAFLPQSHSQFAFATLNTSGLLCKAWGKHHKSQCLVLTDLKRLDLSWVEYCTDYGAIASCLLEAAVHTPKALS